MRAAVTITPASGGTNIIADKAQNSAGAAWTALGDIIIQEPGNDKRAFASSQTNVTLILTVPAGWVFNSATGSVSYATGKDITSASISVSDSEVTVTLSTGGGSKPDLLRISGLNVLAEDGANLPASGNIVRTAANPGTASISGIVNGSTNFGSLSQSFGAMTQLIVSLPDETFTDGSTVGTSGNSGSVPAQIVVVSFNITRLTATDQFYNIVISYSGIKTIGYTGPGGSPTFTSVVNFMNGQSTTALLTILRKAETIAVTANDGVISGPASSILTVAPGSFSKLQLIVPGETNDPGSISGKTGTPDTQTVGAPLNIIVNAVDAEWNFINSVSDVVHLSSSDEDAALPSDAALINGTNSFALTLNSAGPQTITAGDITDPAKTPDTSPDISVNKATTTTNIGSDINPSFYGQPVTFTATVTVNPPSTGTATGTLIFKEGGDSLGTALLNEYGQAALVISLLSPGTHSIIAEYYGDVDYENSSPQAFLQYVNPVITASVTGSGTISPSGTTVIEYGGNQAYSWEAGTGYHFIELLIDGIHSDSVAGYTFTNVITNYTVTANFALNTYTLTTGSVNGSVIKDPDQVSYNHGTDVELTASADAGYHFVNWSGDAVGSANPLTVNMDGNKNITANFAVSDVAAHYSVNPQWNIISLPLNLISNLKDNVFPTALSDAFGYNGSYTPEDTLKNGSGYWMKFDQEEIVTYVGTIRDNDTINVVKGWNLIGTISAPVRVTSIGSIPAGILTSNFFGYSTDYFMTDTLYPGRGYFVMANTDGQLILSSTNGILPANKIRIVAIDEPPPPPPREKGNEIPDAYMLSQNYPNPFNPTTKIRYGLAAAGWVTLKVYNILGQEVKILLDELQDAGIKSVEFNANSLSTGVYYYQIIVRNDEKVSFKTLKKMMLLR